MFRESIFLWVVLSLLILSALIQLYYYLWFYTAPLLKKNVETKESKFAVSVIICARNEANNLAEFLPYVLKQDYPDFEVIVVNDCSEDNSYEVLGNMLAENPHLKISTVNKDPKFTHNKKFAQFIGIKAAKNDILVFTDADCKPESDKWLRMMVSHFSGSTHFVLGYGGYLRKKGLLNTYIRYDTLSIALSYLGMAIRGNPYMGVGRNLAYRRSLFFEKKGFGPHSHIISGDDDLFVNANASGANCKVEFRPEAHTRSVPSGSTGQWISQKKRHFTTAPYYRFGDKLLLSVEPLTRVLLYASFAVLAANKFMLQVTIPVFGARMAVHQAVYTLGSLKLKEKGIAAVSIFFDIFSPVINSIVYISGLLSKPGKNRWK